MHFSGRSQSYTELKKAQDTVFVSTAATADNLL